MHCLLVCIALIEQMLLLQYSQFSHTPQDWQTFQQYSRDINGRWKDGRVLWRSFQFGVFFSLTATYCPLRPDCPHVCPHNVSPFHPFSDPCPLCSPCRRLFVAQSTFHHLNFSHAATSLAPPADILLSTFVDTSPTVPGLHGF